VAASAEAAWRAAAVGVKVNTPVDALTLTAPLTAVAEYFNVLPSGSEATVAPVTTPVEGFGVPTVTAEITGLPFATTAGAGAATLLVAGSPVEIPGARFCPGSSRSAPN
jgi:hypothetical protein